MVIKFENMKNKHHLINIPDSKMLTIWSNWQQIRSDFDYKTIVICVRIDYKFLIPRVMGYIHIVALFV